MQSNYPLHDLLMMHQTKKVIEHLEQDAKNINDLNDLGLSLLQIAAREGLNDAVIYLCFKGANLVQKAEVQHPDSIVCQQAAKSPIELAQEYGHELSIKVLKTFLRVDQDMDEVILKGLYMWAIKTYNKPDELMLPAQPNQFICQGLLELAAFLNKPAWVDFILNCHANFKLRHDVNIRTAAYWAAFHDNPALFLKTSLKNEDNLALTFWQFNETDPDKFKKYCEREEVQSIENLASRIPEDKEHFPVKNAYLMACKNSKVFAKCSDETKYQVAQYALRENNFVALLVVQNSIKNHSDYIGKAADFRQIVEFDVVAMNIAYYDLILQLKPSHHKFLNALGTDQGLLHFIISLRINKGLLTEDEQSVYNTLIKNDELIAGIISKQIRVKNPNMTSENKIKKQGSLLKELGLLYLESKENKETLREKKKTFYDCDFNLLFHTFSFLTGEKIGKVLLDESEEIIRSLLLTDQPEQKDEKKSPEVLADRKAISLTCRLFYKSLSKNKSKEIPTLNSEIQQSSDRLNQLRAKVAILTEFKNLLEKENNQKIKFKNRWGAAWRIAAVSGASAIFILNIIWLIHIHAEQGDISSLMALIDTGIKICLTNNTYNCDNFNHPGTIDTGCHSLLPCKELKLPVDAKIDVPPMCDELCGKSGTIDLSSVAAILSMTTFTTPLILMVFPLLVSLREIWKGTFYTRNALLVKPLSSYSDNLRRKLPLVSGLLPSHQEIIDTTEMQIAFNRVDDMSQRISADVAREERKCHAITGRRKLFQSLFPAKKEVKETKLEKEDFTVDILEEAPRVANTNSLNHSDWKTPLLQNGEDNGENNEPVRRSICPACVIL